MGGLDGGDPVAHGLVHRVLERAAAGLGRPHLGAEQAHAEHVELLALHVDLAHVDDAVEAEQRGGGGGGHAVLAGAGLGDEAVLAHALGQQGLAEHVVDLVAAGVVEVLALEQQAQAELVGEALAHGDRAGAAGVVAQQAVEAAAELGVGPGVAELALDLLAGADERLGDELAAEAPEPAVAGVAHDGIGRAGGGVGHRRSVQRSASGGCGEESAVPACLGGGDEGPDEVGVLATRGGLDAGGHVDTPGTHGARWRRRRVGAQSAGEQDAVPAGQVPDQGPVERDAAAGGGRVEQHDVGAVAVDRRRAAGRRRPSPG